MIIKIKKLFSNLFTLSIETKKIFYFQLNYSISMSKLGDFAKSLLRISTIIGLILSIVSKISCQILNIFQFFNSNEVESSRKQWIAKLFLE